MCLMQNEAHQNDMLELEQEKAFYRSIQLYAWLLP